MAKKKKKKKCPRCGEKFVNLGAHMVSHKGGSSKKSKSKKGDNEDLDHGLTDIRVVGIGGAGGNIISRMREKNKNTLQGIEYIAINTDAQDLKNASADKKIQIGKSLTRGMGAGMNPDLGKRAAEENKSEIAEAVEGADIVFVTGGLGGGTCTGASPVVSEIIRDQGILTIGMVTKPFSFEGTKRMSLAQEGLGKLTDQVDSLVVVPNDRVFTVISKDTPVKEAFEYVDDVLNYAVQAIAELINMPGIINVDFADIKSVLKDAGPSMIGVGIASGKERSTEAVNGAVNSPLLEASVDGAKGALFSIAGGEDLKMTEINDIAKSVVSNLDKNAQVIFGAYHDKGLKKNSIKVTVIATGFGGVVSGTNSTKVPQLFSNKSKSTSKSSSRNVKVNAKDKKKKSSKSDDDSDTPKTPEEDPDDDSSAWDIPAFLRKKDK